MSNRESIFLRLSKDTIERLDKIVDEKCVGCRIEALRYAISENQLMREQNSLAQSIVKELRDRKVIVG